MASYTLMQFVDTWFLAHTSDSVDAPTAAANAGMLAFSIISLGMGVLWVVNTLVSQSFGRKNYAACGRFLWQGVWFALAFSAAAAAGPAVRVGGVSPGSATKPARSPWRRLTSRSSSGRRCSSWSAPPSGSSCWRSTSPSAC